MRDSLSMLDETTLGEDPRIQALSKELRLEFYHFLVYLITSCHYDPIRLLELDPETGAGTYAAIMPLNYTHAIITGNLGDRFGYFDRWCYDSKQSAIAALEAWNGEGEPEGWHRHPNTGRRREIEDGQVLREYINF